MAPYRITVVCLGNICRSPMAEAVLRQRVAEAGLSGAVVIDSAGTGDWHVGHAADRRALSTLKEAGYSARHTARQITPDWMADIDLLLAMDEENYEDLAAMLDRVDETDRPELRMMRGFDPELADLPQPHPRLVVPDPYYGSRADFVEVLRMVEKAADGLVDGLPDRLGARA